MLKFVSHALSLNKNAWAVWKTVVLLDNKLLAGTPPGPTEQGWGGYDDTKGRMPAPQAPLILKKEKQNGSETRCDCLAQQPVYG
uniref:Uncharacterized protein n=1 Tax=viral metagenome TaxID=1070528 RepID=A0A6M3KEU3_9ZZZZ